MTPKVLSRVSVIGCLLGLALVLAAPLARDRIGADASASPSTDSGSPSPEPRTPGPTDAPHTPVPETGPGVVPKTVPARGTLISPTQAVPPEPPEAPFVSFAESNGEPVRWDPCTPIGYVVRRRAGPENGFELIQQALQRISDASGLSFRFEGFTNELPGTKTRFGSNGTAAAWIGWAFDDEVADLAPQTPLTGERVGLGGPSWNGGSARIFSGRAVMRSDATLAQKFGRGPTYGSVILHELGHMVGLGHSSSPQDLMFPSLTYTSSGDWGPGDRAGLYALGSSKPCFPSS